MPRTFKIRREPVRSSTCGRCTRTRSIYLALMFLPLALEAHEAAAQDDNPVAPYVDDTFKILDSDIETLLLGESYGYEPYRYSEPADGRPFALDARESEFVVANSRNPDPSYSFTCDMGSLVINPYPLNVYYADMTAIVGGIVLGYVPQDSDWEPTYCNSAAVHFKYASAGTIDGIRVTGAWDAFRMAADSPRLTVRNSWISDVRDDALENDYFYSAVFEDNLIDGTFQGISMHSGGTISADSPETVFLSGNVIRLREYLYKAEQRFGALFKSETTSPGSKIYNTVLAVDYQGGRTWSHLWEGSWAKILDCSNNVFLWLSDLPIPASVAMPPSSCFTVATGQEAREMWAQAKQNWINCHPHVRRSNDDPESSPGQCVANTYGGYSRNPASTPLPPQVH